MVYTNELSLKTVFFLFMNKGFKKCEIWKRENYYETCDKELRSDLIASKKIVLLEKAGLSSEEALWTVIREGHQKPNKTNLALLGEPIAVGCIEELSNNAKLWKYTVADIIIKGFCRRKLIILVN